ncbi:MAG: hypothetical protein WBG48_07660 [Pricia sp.]
MLEDGFKSDKYSGILANLRDNGHLDQKDVDTLLKDFISARQVNLNSLDVKKANIVTEALMDNYNRIIKSK